MIDGETREQEMERRGYSEEQMQALEASRAERVTGEPKDAGIQETL